MVGSLWTSWAFTSTTVWLINSMTCLSLRLWGMAPHYFVGIRGALAVITATTMCGCGVVWKLEWSCCHCVLKTSSIFETLWIETTMSISPESTLCAGFSWHLVLWVSTHYQEHRAPIRHLQLTETFFLSALLTFLFLYGSRGPMLLWRLHWETRIVCGLGQSGRWKVSCWLSGYVVA